MIFLFPLFTILIGVVITSLVCVTVFGLVWVYKMIKSMKDLED